MTHKYCGYHLFLINEHIWLKKMAEVKHWCTNFLSGWDTVKETVQMLTFTASRLTCIMDGVHPEELSNIMCPGLSLLWRWGLKSEAVFGARCLSHPHLKPQTLLSNTLGQTHLSCLKHRDMISGYDEKLPKPIMCSVFRFPFFLGGWGVFWVVVLLHC